MAEGHACMLPMPTPAEFLNRLEHLYKTSSRKPRMLLISFPHNPTTHCVDLQFFRDIVALAAHHGTMIVHDFAYAALARIKSYLDYGVFQPIQIASIIALRECAKDTEKIRMVYQKRRDVLITG